MDAVSGVRSHIFVMSETKGSVGADHAFYLIRVEWFCWDMPLLCGWCFLACGDGCLDVDLIDLDLVREVCI
jgi:hypothetical protein